MTGILDAAALAVYRLTERYPVDRAIMVALRRQRRADWWRYRTTPSVIATILAAMPH
jgi:hypothetical protein